MAIFLTVILILLIDQFDKNFNLIEEVKPLEIDDNMPKYQRKNFKDDVFLLYSIS